MKYLKKFLASLISVTMLSCSAVGQAYAVGTESNHTAELLTTVEMSLDYATTFEDAISEPVYDSFFAEDAFVCSIQYPDGTFEYACNIDGKIHHKVFLNGTLMSYEVIAEAPTISLSDSQLSQIDDYLEEYRQNASLEELNAQLSDLNCTTIVYGKTIAIVAADVSSADKSVYCGMDELINHSDFGELNSAYSSTKSFYCTPLSQNKNVIIRDTRTNYVEQNYKAGTFAAGASIATSAASVMMEPQNLLNWLGLSLSIKTFPYSVFIHNSINAKAYHYRYGEVYDSTQKEYVTCASEYGNDYFVVSRQNKTGPYAWGVEPTPIDELYPDQDIASKAAHAYNNAIELYGYWKW